MPNKMKIDSTLSRSEKWLYKQHFKHRALIITAAM
jgi:hypothetical protein